MSDEAPGFIVVGEWRDNEWLTLSCRIQPPPTLDELRRICAGPRGHPYGPDAFQVIRDGQVLVFPNKEAAGV